MDDRFVNPYTFVPLPKGGAKRSDCTCLLYTSDAADE